MVAPIVGICRFSFLGRGDWQAFSGIPRGSAAEAAAIERSRAALYDDARLRFRFHSFERLTLASLRAQTDPDFHFLVLSSPALPRPWQERLRALCQTLPQARLVLSDAADVGTALAPVLAELARPAGPAIQFRLDDDDCLCGDYVARLGRAARIMQDQRSFAFSLPRALVVTHYQGGGPRHYECSLPFHAAGAAARLSQPHRSVFAFGHYALMRRFPAMLDHGAIGSLQLKFQGHDSRMVAAVPGSGLSPLDEPGFRELLARNFPFLDPSCLSGLMALRDSAG
ncbi:Putative rhamnosyl transferase [Paracoccus thiocyanatus]|uniref:Rhamnosyl transferase n=1 Tax=Paracoccus thiocyanatus TaxID=34006 RepID=A0A1N6PPX9_9RHOB|nr:glycosyltransferase [Paracoccus thiocyanatus]SIQ06376.1 Putative rhamnosyl transferase [Paracoccus thiocyanatus]